LDSVSVPADFLVVVGRLALAAMLGAIAGANRELRQKPAGLRTHSLVALGAALASLTGLMVAAMAGGADNGAISRVIQGVFAGIGFIGGGVILHREHARTSHAVHGLTTAALLWIVAGTGVATGLGLWRSAVATVLLALAVLVGGKLIEQRLHRGGENNAAPDK
jgi:putative Mg2+ transporter-C (MgtC) family protein